MTHADGWIWASVVISGCDWPILTPAVALMVGSYPAFERSEEIEASLR